MLNSDFENFKGFLEANWPNKFTDRDVQYWIRELQPWEIERVQEKIVEFKNSHKFAPKAPEIKALCQEAWPVKFQAVAREVSRFVTVVAQQWAKSQPKLASDPESTLIMRYYRYWFCRLRKSITDVADLRKQNGQQPQPDDEKRIEIIRNKSTRDCRAELLACRLTWEQADAASSWIDSTDLEFEQAIDSLHGMAQQAA
jgi:hypothetical protein